MIKINPPKAWKYREEQLFKVRFSYFQGDRLKIRLVGVDERLIWAWKTYGGDFPSGWIPEVREERVGMGTEWGKWGE